MKKMLPAFFRNLVLSAFLLLIGFSSRASHIVGAELTYKWITCNTYQVTMEVYGNCGETSTVAFACLNGASPTICIFDGSTSFPSVTLAQVAPNTGVEVTPVCPDSIAYDACTLPFSTTPGIKKFTYTATYTFPHNSANWRLVFNGVLGGCSSPGRAADITNISGPGGTLLALEDTLNNSYTNTRGHNSSPVLTVEPVPFFCPNNESCYNPGAVDVYDTSHFDEPSGDSLNFSLITPENATSTCGIAPGLCSYLPIPSCTPGGPLLSGSHPLQVVDCSPASFSFDPVSGQLCFNPISQRSVVVYNIEEFRNDTVSNIHTIAGLGGAFFCCDFGPAISAGINKPAGIRTDKAGNIYFADQSDNRIRKVSTTGIISTVAGNGSTGYCGDNALAIRAALNSPAGVAVDTAGNVIFADNNNNAVRKINTSTGIITTIAGNGTPGFTGDGGNAKGTISTIAGTGVAGFLGNPAAATSAELLNPAGICKDVFGNIYFADYTNNRIREINLAGTVFTIAGNAGPGAYSGDGGLGTAAFLNNPEGMWISGTFLYFADNGNNVVRKIDLTSNIITTVAGTGTAGYSGDGLAATTAMLNHPHSVYVDAALNIYISDAGNNRIRKVDPFGTMLPVAGNGVPGFAGDGTTASLPGVELNNPYGLFGYGTGNVYIADAGNNRIRVISGGNIYTYAGGAGAPAFSGDGGPATAARFNTPTDIYMDSHENMFVADKGNSCIREIMGCDSIVSTLAGRGLVPGFSGDGSEPDSSKLSGPSFIFWDAFTTNFYISDAGNNRIRIITASELNHPTGVFVDNQNNTYISDAGNQVVRKITAATGVINTIVGTPLTVGFGGDGTPPLSTGVMLSNPYGLFVDNAGNLYIADAGNNRIRKVGINDTITTVAGSGLTTHTGDNCPALATAVGLNQPSDVSVDGAGNMFIADRLNNCVRKVDVYGNIETLAGTGVAGGTGDGGAAFVATLNNPSFLCLDASKNVLVSDFNNNRVRMVDHNTTVNRVMVGTMQREMTFKVLPACTYFAPHGAIDSVTGTTGTLIDSLHLTACQFSGNFVIHVNPHEPDTAYHITVTASGLNTGFSFTVDSDNTNHPHASVTGNTSLITPGIYTFYLTYTDNHCPLVGTETQPFTVQIYPVPSIKDSLLSIATCADQAGYLIVPGGFGSPWTVKVSSLVFPYDTVQTFTSDTGSFVDSLKPHPGLTGSYVFTIYTSVSNECARGDTITPAVPSSSITVSTLNPDYCGAPNGRIYIDGLPAGLQDTSFYSFNHVLQPRQAFVSSSIGSDTLFSLLAGQYDTIIIQQSNCYDTLKNAFNLPGTVTLNNPLFTFRTVTGKSPTKCGYCNGVDTLFGLHPSQFDTFVYRFTDPNTGAISRISTSSLIGADSFYIFSGLCSGLYDSFSVNTAGVLNCQQTWPGETVLQGPKDTDNFSYTIHYGCNGDTVMFTNLSTAAPLDVLYYNWDFGDGTTDLSTNPMHIYNNTTNDTVHVILHISNLKCLNDTGAVFVLNNYVHADFSDDPSQFICQLSPVTFTNLSTGVNPTYTWYYGDGTSDITTNSVHTFTNSGTYTIKLVAADNLIPLPPFFTPCYDTTTHTIAIDSTSSIKIDATDSVICAGQEITFTGVYAHIGDTGNVWTFGDGSSRINTNPVIHAYDGAQVYTITVTALYRSCAAQTSSRAIRVFDYPSIYLGADTSICPGGVPITLFDNTNATNTKASWAWSTGDSTAGITVAKAGVYSAMVTIDGCSSYDTVVVAKDCYMDIPNVFTPNGDGTNDYFYPRQLLTKGLVRFKMDIYNRWGQLLYETTNTDGRGWDGSFNGVPQPEGVYIYLIEGTFKDGQIEHHQGNVTLLK